MLYRSATMACAIAIAIPEQIYLLSDSLLRFT
jgi:hypothetical protein